MSKQYTILSQENMTDVTVSGEIVTGIAYTVLLENNGHSEEQKYFVKDGEVADTILRAAVDAIAPVEDEPLPEPVVVTIE